VSAITLEAIQAKQTELAKLIQQFSEQPKAAGRTIEIEDRYIKLEPGEYYAGTVLDADGNHMHDLVLMPQRHGKRLDWKAALEWAEEIGGALPTRQEQSLIFANCKPHLEGVYHWSCEEYEGDASCAWGCFFLVGSQYYFRKHHELAAVAVRLIPLSS
jgi:hypothetical protein